MERESPECAGCARIYGLQTVKLLQGKGDEAVQAMQQLVQKNPTVIAFRYQLANFQASYANQVGKTDPSRGKQLLQEAADNYKEILKTTANSAEVWLRLGILQRELGQSDAALASFEQAGNADPKSDSAFLNQGMLLEQTGKKEGSERGVQQSTRHKSAEYTGPQ